MCTSSSSSVRVGCRTTWRYSPTSVLRKAMSSHFHAVESSAACGCSARDTQARVEVTAIAATIRSRLLNMAFPSVVALKTIDAASLPVPSRLVPCARLAHLRSRRGVQTRISHRKAAVLVALDPGTDLPRSVAGIDRAGIQVLPGGLAHVPRARGHGRVRPGALRAGD